MNQFHIHLHFRLRACVHGDGGDVRVRRGHDRVLHGRGRDAHGHGRDGLHVHPLHPVHLVPVHHVLQGP